MGCVSKKKVWRTGDGREIPYNELEDQHLLSILKWIEKRAYEGHVDIVRRGVCVEGDGDVWYEEYDYHGVQVLERFDYFGLAKEAVRRALLTENDIAERVAPFLLDRRDLVRMLVNADCNSYRNYILKTTLNKIREKYWKQKGGK